MASRLFGVQAYDPAVLSATVLVLLAAAFAAAAIPARRPAVETGVFDADVR